MRVFLRFWTLREDTATGDSGMTQAIANGLIEIIPDLLSKGASLYKDSGDKIHRIDTESCKRFLDDQITVEKINLEDKGQ